MQSNQSKRIAAYTAVEIILIVLLLLLLGSIVAPGAVSAYDRARGDHLQKDLEFIRSQVELYRNEHGGYGPHVNENGELDLENMVNRLCGATFPSGKLSRYGSCGPYISEWPSNSFCKSVISQSIKFGSATQPPRDGSSGWYYNIDSCLVSANSSKGVSAGTDSANPLIAIIPGPDKKDSQSRMFRLKGIMRGPEGAEVIINGQRLHEGENIDDGVIRKIGSHWVELELGGKHLTIEMPAPKDDDNDGEYDDEAEVASPTSRPASE